MGDEYRTVQGQGNWTWEMSTEQYRDKVIGHAFVTARYHTQRQTGGMINGKQYKQH